MRNRNDEVEDDLKRFYPKFKISNNFGQQKNDSFMKINKLLPLLLLMTLGLSACQSVRQWTSFRNKKISEVSSLELITSIEIPYQMEFQETQIGGITGITFNTKNKNFYTLVSNQEDNSTSRFYQVQIKDWDKVPTLEFKKVFFLSERNNKNFQTFDEFIDRMATGKRTKFTVPQPEDMAYSPKDNQLVWANNQHFYTLDTLSFYNQSFIAKMELTGRMTYTYALPKTFKFSSYSNLQPEKMLKAISIAPTGEKLFLAPEKSLMEDRASELSYDTGYVRIFQFRNDSRSFEIYYAYPIDIPNDLNIDPVNEKRNIAALTALNDSLLLVLERVENLDGSNRFLLFAVDLNKDNQIKSRKNLIEFKKFLPLNKRLIADFNEIEPLQNHLWDGMCLGPVVNGRQSLVLVSNNEFSEEKKTVFSFFWLIP